MSPSTSNHFLSFCPNLTRLLCFSQLPSELAMIMQIAMGFTPSDSQRRCLCPLLLYLGSFPYLHLWYYHGHNWLYCLNMKQAPHRYGHALILYLAQANCDTAELVSINLQEKESASAPNQYPTVVCTMTNP